LEWHFLDFSSPLSSLVTTFNWGVEIVLVLTAILTVAALFYLGYVMIRPERF
jgi:hypothetical protein